MGTRIVAKGVDAEAFATELGVPVRTGVKGVFLVNTDEKKASKNYAPGSTKNGTPVGSPAMTAQYGFLSGIKSGVSQHIETDIVETENFTWIAAVKADMSDPLWPATPADAQIPVAIRANPVSSFSPSTANKIGAGIYTYTNQKYGMSIGVLADGSTNGSFAINLDADMSKFNIVAFRFNVATKTLSAKNYFTGVLRSSALAANQVRQTSGRKIRLGASSEGTYGGKIYVAAAQIHDVALSDADMDKNALFLKAYCERKGIVFG